MKKVLLLFLITFFIFSHKAIGQNLPNIYTNSGSIVHIAAGCTNLTIHTKLGYDNPLSGYVTINSKFYLSSDSILDSSDSLILSSTGAIYTTVNNWSVSMTISPLTVGVYYIVYEHDATNVITESNENDNVGYAILIVDPVSALPFSDNFETADSLWKAYSSSSVNHPLVWERGKGYRHHLEGTHSGDYSWHTSKTIDNPTQGSQYLETPYLDLTTLSGNINLNFWFKDNLPVPTTCDIQYTTNCSSTWTTLANIPIARDDDWDFFNTSLNSLSSNSSVKLRVRLVLNYLKPEGINIDDFYIGSTKPDLSIERDKLNRFTTTSSSTDTLHYFLNNSGLATAPVSITAFYWSTDSIFDNSDQLLGTVQESSLGDTTKSWRSFIFNKPTLNVGKYYIFYVLDTANVINEMREYNDTGYYVLYQESVQGTPYYNDFETQITNWRHNASLGNDDWEWAIPNGTILNSAFSGTEAWVTNSNGIMSPMSRMHLYTPIFNLTTLNDPVLTFDMKLNSSGTCDCSEGKMNMSYSTDGGTTWHVLDTTNQSYNRWYYPIEYNDWTGKDGIYYIPNNSRILFQPEERAFVAANQYNSRNADRNTHYVIDIGALSNFSKIQFRFNIATLQNSDSSALHSLLEGALIDNFSISEAYIDLNVSHKKTLMISPLAQKIKINMFIKNSGNYISQPSIFKYYLSSDTILDSTDYLLVLDTIPAIRPDMNAFINDTYNSPPNLGNYNYLIYKLDASNTNIESNENNNIGYWSLGMGGISDFPYYEDFNDSISEGWPFYVTSQGNQLHDSYRFRNFLAPGEITFSSKRKNGEMFTDWINDVAFDVPYWYIETPAFDFSKSQKLSISFDLMSLGTISSSSGEGSNLEYSTDGGNNWNILTAQLGSTVNWYNNNNVHSLNSEPGWSHTPPSNGAEILDSTFMNISFLRGEKNVVFRFKYRGKWELLGNGTIQGMRIDNFRIEDKKLDYISQDTNTTVIFGDIKNPSFKVNYSIKNIGDLDGTSTNTKFYWSKDSLLDPQDILLKSISENPIQKGMILNDSTLITYPTPINQPSYYLFYVSDADSDLVESNENNNVGSFKVIFSSYVNYKANFNENVVNAFIAKPSFDIDYKIVNDGISNGDSSITIFYWSTDSILNNSDQNILQINQKPIAVGDTIDSLLSIIYPTPIAQVDYYLFYKSDGNDSIFEANENDNVGKFKIHFDYGMSLANQALDYIKMYVYKNVLIINTSKNFPDYLFDLNIFSVNGQLVYHDRLKLLMGKNILKLPDNIAEGIYMISLNHENNVITCKASLGH